MESVVITWLLRENEARLLKVKTRCLIVLGFRRARFPYGQHLERRDLRRPRASTIGTGYLKVRSLRTKFTTVTRKPRASSRSISDWPESISSENLKRVWNLVWYDLSTHYLSTLGARDALSAVWGLDQVVTCSKSPRFFFPKFAFGWRHVDLRPTPKHPAAFEGNPSVPKVGTLAFSPAAIWPETTSSPSKSNETIPWQSPWPLVSLACVSSVTRNLQRVFRRILYTNGRSLCQAFLEETVETRNTKLDATHVLLRKLRRDYI